MNYVRLERVKTYVVATKHGVNKHN